MAKKLKKKIEGHCELIGLESEERRARAEKILANHSWKQELCNNLIGLSFKDLERTLMAVIEERELKDDRPRNSRICGSVSNVSPKKQNSGRTLVEILAAVYSPRASDGELSKHPKTKAGVLQNTADDDGKAQ